jgi:hypothetical protein
LKVWGQNREGEMEGAERKKEIRRREARRSRNLAGRMRPMHWSQRVRTAKMIRHDTDK